MASTAIEGPADVTDHPWRMLVGGEPSPAASGEVFDTENPATGQQLATVPDAGPSDVDAAVRGGELAQREWAASDVRERGRLLRGLAGVLRENAEELGTLDALDSGHPVTAMIGDVRGAATAIENYADWALRLGGEVIPASTGHLNYTVREPYGVVARIVPYNHPAMFAATSVAGPLLAGNAVVLKAAPQTPLSALRIAELFGELLPAGLLSVLTGAGSRTGELLVRHPSVRRIAFTGSVAAGQAVLAGAASAGIKQVSLELGGKNAAVVCPDADLDEAAAGAVRGMNFHWTGGQSCGSTSRLLLHESIGAEVLDRVRERLATIRLGDPLDPATEMGCLVSAAQWDKVMHFIEAGGVDGARLLAGGGRPPGAGFASGHWVAPTLFDRVDPGNRIATEEIFGPVLSVLTFADEQEAVRVANGVPYGLTASVWTDDLNRAHRLTRKLAAGYVWVNDASRHFTGLPFGGVKSSGLGREECVEELLSYTETKSVHVALRPDESVPGDQR